MGPKEPVAGVWNAVEKAGPTHRVVPSEGRNHRAKGIRLQFKILGIGPRAHLRPKLLGRFDGPQVTHAHRRNAPATG